MPLSPIAMFSKLQSLGIFKSHIHSCFEINSLDFASVICKRLASEISKNSFNFSLKLEMKLVDMSFTIDGTKRSINYVCEDRVDFRELVKGHLDSF